MNNFIFNTEEKDVGIRIDKFLSEKFDDKTRTALQKYIGRTGCNKTKPMIFYKTLYISSNSQ